ncbi:NADPH-ferrihemoprotein reductase [Talaromyces islandicus]|uniref:Bifunctional cytochrome P450/NADPH--P450 reductase n=1 Tax=Talaromyces islandicus TaxID=28573 RepID=A0A0U1LVA0_TALIS|nr:NADPH-ferrihemoprotein reductase [Talaromyces islandicus]
MTAVPHPPGWPVMGNALDGMTYAQYHEKYGPIFQLIAGPGKIPTLYVCSVELLNEICDETRFAKIPTRGPLFEVRNNLTHDGLFTASHGEENWGIAHRVLMPVFNGITIKNMFDEMHDIASQLVLKWARFTSGTEIDVTGDFTRLTLDTLALTTMDTRFNSFYSETPHPFISAMVSFLIECDWRSRRPGFVNDYVFRKTTQKYREDVNKMREIGREVVYRRRNSTYRKKDLIDAMIHEADPKTGQKMTEESIIDNIATFLIAGHETTSGLLSFMLYQLMKNPDVMRKARVEVDSVLGQGSMTPEMLSRLPYLTAVIRETLRLHPTAPAFSVSPKQDTSDNTPIFIGRKQYEVGKKQPIVALLQEIHRDPAVYGDDADQFKPERMVDEHFYNLPKGAYKPFGNGARACIGRALALQEATITMALLIQNFEFDFADASYNLVIKKTLTIKPTGFKAIARLRPGLNPTFVQRRLVSDNLKDVSLPESNIPMAGTDTKVELRGQNLKPPSKLGDLVICYGSNTGTCQTLAHTLASEAPKHGFRPTVMSMDQAAGKFFTEANLPVVVITASYEGQPPDNASSFASWLTNLETGSNTEPLDGHFHAVYGCGHRDWVDTFQKFPTWVDTALTDCGSKAIVTRGFSDVSNDDTFNEFDLWSDQSLWPALAQEYYNDHSSNEGNPQKAFMREKAEMRNEGFEVVQSSRMKELDYDGREATVLESTLLTVLGEPEKRHIKIRLPSGMDYSTGDYLAILPVNRDETVKVAMTRFGLAVDAQVVSNKSVNGLPSEPICRSAYIVLKELVELNHPATDKNIRAIALSIPEQSERKALEKVVSSKQGKEQRPSVLHLLIMFPSATLSFAEYLSMLPPLHVRRYSVSSSPLSDPSSCTLTYSVANFGPEAAHSELRVFGAASNYLANLKVTDRVLVSHCPGNANFRLPTDLTATPIILICTGSGLAPFKGFVEERAAIMKRRPKICLAKCILLIGCRHPEKDALYMQELEDWEKAGAVELQYAFSTAPERSYGCRYVQDRLWKSRENLMPLLLDGRGKMFFCGGAKPLEGVTKAVVKAYAEHTGKSLDEASAWFRRIRNKQFASDVYN